MRQYHRLLKEILSNGDVMYEPRTEEYVLGLAGEQSIYYLQQGFPLMTTKSIQPRLPFEEVFWKLRGERNVKSLFDKGIHIWDANAFDRYLKVNGLREQFPKHSQQWNEEFTKYKERLAKDPEFAAQAGDLGPVYGYQWRHWPKFRLIPAHAEGNEWVPERWGKEEVDQLTNLLKGIKEKPGSRYHVLSSWNVSDLPNMALGPCPMIHQFSVFGKNLDLNMYQRSCDVYLGVPFNIAQDSLLTHMVAAETDLMPRKFIHSYGNVHSYLGVPPRSDFWMNEENVRKFQDKFISAMSNRSFLLEREGYLNLKEWYLANSPPESEGNEKKDHIPFILTQLSKSPGKLPQVKLKDVPFFEAIQMPAMDYVEVQGYEPEKWDSKAEMAA